MTINALAYTSHHDDHQGLPLVLLHAFPLSGAMFDEVALRMGRRLIVPDLRGFGASSLPADDEPSLDLMADDVADLLDQLGIDKAGFAGLSMGGYVTMAMLRRHPERVAGIVLMDTKASSDTPEAAANRHRMAENVLSIGARAVRPMLDSLIGQTTHTDRPEVVRRVAGWLDGVRPEGVAWAQRAMAARPASVETLAQAGVPGAVVVGSEDVLSTVDDAHVMADALGDDTKVHVIPDAGHLTAVETPDVVARIVDDQVTNWGL